jgi:hypothetical protein
MFRTLGPVEILIILLGPTSGLLAAIYLAISLRRNQQRQ